MMKLVIFSLIFVANVLAKPSITKRRYDGHKVLKVLPKVYDDAKAILNLKHKYRLDFWKHPRTNNSSFDIRVKPEDVTDFITDLKTIGADVKVWIDDLQKLMDEQEEDQRPHKRQSALGLSMTSYHSYTDIIAYLNAVAANNRYATLETLGQSRHNRDIKLIKFSTGSSPTKKIIFMDGGIHAREWIATAVNLYMIDQLHRGTDPDVASLMSKFDFYLVPLVNPDGYEYTRSTDRMWRKNLSPSYHTSHGSSIFGGSFNYCIRGETELGVDLNRNFNYHWNPSNGGSSDQCEETYAGPHAQSEPETKAIAGALDKYGPNTLAYLNFHSYGEYWIYPWGYTTHLPNDWRDLEHIGRVAASAIYNKYHQRFTVGEDTVELYAAAGGADDYAKGHANIKYAYTVELRDKGHYGFVLPSQYIQPSGVETWAAVKAMANELKRLYHL